MNDFFLEATEEEKIRKLFYRTNKCRNLQGASEDPQNIRISDFSQHVAQILK